MTEVPLLDPVLAEPPAPVPAVVRPAVAPDRWSRTWRYWVRRPGLVLAIVVVALATTAAFFPTWFTGQDPLRGVPAEKLQAPSWQHLFGTDQLGRDLFTRVVYGSAASLQATVIAVAISFVAGSLIGLLAGVIGSWFDDAAMRLVDVMLAIPALLLSLALVTALGFGTVNVAVAVGVASIARFARLMRAEVIRIRGDVYVEAARVSGSRWPAVVGRHILPNALGPVFVLAALQFGVAILAVSSLSFLGFGAPPPAPEWGSLVSAGRNFLATAWWLSILPGIVVAASVLAANRIARALDVGGRFEP